MSCSSIALTKKPFVAKYGKKQRGRENKGSLGGQDNPAEPFFVKFPRPTIELMRTNHRQHQAKA